MKQLSLLLLLSVLPLFAYSQTPDSLVVLETPTMHSMVTKVSEEVRQNVIHLKDGQVVKFSNLYYVEFLQNPFDREANRLYFKIYKSVTDVDFGLIRMRDDGEVSVLVREKEDGKVVWTGQRNLTDKMVQVKNTAIQERNRKKRGGVEN